METDKGKIEISCGDILTLTQEISKREVMLARLEMKYERLEEDHINVKAQLAKSESERLEVTAENRTLKEKVQLQDEVIQTYKAQKQGQSFDKVDFSKLSEDFIEQLLSYLLEKYLLLSIEKSRDFMKTRHLDLPTASVIRGFVEDTVPDNLKAKLLEVIHNVMLLPAKPEPPKIEPTVNGGQAFFGPITNSEFLGKEKDEDE